VNQREALLVAQLWQAELAKLGIDLVVEEISAAVRWEEVYNPDTELNIMFMGMVIGYDSPNEFLGSLFHSGWSWFPFSGFANPEFDALVEEALSLEAVDKDKSDRLYQEAEQILYDEVAAIFALDLPQDFAVRANIEGFNPNPLYGYEVFWWQLSRK
jgi:peptide/nickel transport system substrate-binding protein